MQTVVTFMIAVGLAMDAFAVSLGVGTAGQAKRARPIFRLAFHLGLFQGLFTFLGWLAGLNIATLISSIDHWIALGLLSLVGVRMLRSGLDQREDSRHDDFSRGLSLVIVSVATSIDAFAVGLSMGMLQARILNACLIIAMVTATLSLFGLLAGGRLNERFGKRMEVLGGLLLIGIGLRILMTHISI
jgi:manganese efflux pump family protein